jgi:hypothetical protein
MKTIPQNQLFCGDAHFLANWSNSNHLTLGKSPGKHVSDNQMQEMFWFPSWREALKSSYWSLYMRPPLT